MKTVEQLAREAGWTGYDSLDERLQRFHDLAIAQYRESLLAGVGEPFMVLEDIGWEFTDGIDPEWLTTLPIGTKTYTADQMAAAVAIERERCAAICDGATGLGDKYQGDVFAAAIRGQQ